MASSSSTVRAQSGTAFNTFPLLKTLHCPEEAAASYSENSPEVILGRSSHLEERIAESASFPSNKRFKRGRIAACYQIPW